MKRLQTIMQEIIVITARIETDYPEIHKYLLETPVEFVNSDAPIGIIEMQKHLETLKEILNRYLENRRNDMHNVT